MFKEIEVTSLTYREKTTSGQHLITPLTVMKMMNSNLNSENS